MHDQLVGRQEQSRGKSNQGARAFKPKLTPFTLEHI